MLFQKYFRRKIWLKILAFFAQTTASSCKTLIITLVFEKNANLSQNSGKKIAKNVFITSIAQSGHPENVSREVERRRNDVGSAPKPTLAFFQGRRPRLS
jgi:hypothetical protein